MATENLIADIEKAETNAHASIAEESLPPVEELCHQHEEAKRSGGKDRIVAQHEIQ